MNQRVKGNETGSRRDRAYQAISGWIIRGEMAPGESLTENEVANRLNMSRTPVREALHRLEQDGLVEIKPRVGAFVRSITMKDLQEIFEVREAAEGMLSRLSALRGDVNALSELERMFRAASKAIEDDRRERLYEEAGERLHAYIARESGNSRFMRILDSLKIQIRTQQRMSRHLAGRIDRSAAEHLAVVRALKADDPDDAERAMREHIRSTRDSLFDAYRIGAVH